uniref:Highly reducing polyketide synthase aurA n=1 Tax=Calcarisporium arbuscula TaxID=240499 RepID=AURA_CALAK|nr:RecName: Full=Highly reducing polyketide synthase aurA; Short=HR-PKS aurvA; AltName: Full=Aurovertin biosynthesis cluster protein A [Calcarisporium arbuscula]ALD83627.1 polyketide synthase [Calcarisporium arbuscula]
MTPEPIAIIGSGCKFPGSSTSPSRLWDLISKPKDVASKPPADRFNIDGFYHPNPTNLLTTNAKESYFISENVRAFDNTFFNIAANEATSLDPQQRLLLETVYESVEAAGLRLEALRGSSTGVFCGVMCADWEAVVGLDKVVPEYAISGLARSNLANRISYFFDWNGPSMSIDTACSSSMVALHQGITALQSGECSAVAVIGTNLILTPNLYFAASNVHMLSPESRGRMWDHKANGYVRGEGVASLMLKRLSDAVADGDRIECVIRASGVNQDGRTLGLTMPSGEAQEKLIRSTYALAGLDPSRAEDRPQYFEAHGTGTQAGDYQEASGIYNTFFGANPKASAEEVLHVGSIKTVIGHSEGCAGLAGLIKASLCIQHGLIPPNLHFERLNPKLEPYSSHLKVPTALTKWPELPSGVPRRVSVNSFGFGGTNSHAILESYEPNLHGTTNGHVNGTSKKTNGLLNGASNLLDSLTNGEESTKPALLPFVFSAASEKTLGALLEKYDSYLGENPNVEAMDLAWSLIQKRSALMYRVTLYAPTIEGLQSEIQRELALRKANTPSTVISRPDTGKKRILGIFTGQGAQWPQMGLDIISTFPNARVWFEELQASLDSLPTAHKPDFSLLEELSAPKPSSRVQEAAVAQPICTAVQIVLVKLLSAIGISFDQVVGHSSGEVAAAYAAGVLNAHDAIRIAYLRGRVAHLAGANDKAGGMLAAGLSIEEATAFCELPEFAGRIMIAACNSPSSVTLSGDADAIQEAEKHLKGQDKFARRVLVDTAYHSHHMEPCSDPYLSAMTGCKIQLGEPTATTWYSTVYEGEKPNSSSHANALVGEYWKDNMRNPVLFYQALMQSITDAPPSLIVEVGPHPALKGPVLQAISEAVQTNSTIPYISTLSRGATGVKALAVTIGSLWTHLGAEGVKVEQYVALREPSRKLKFIHDLPSYPFDHSQSYWTETRRSKAYLGRGPRHELLGDLSEENTEGEWRWRNFLFRSNLEYLEGHQIQAQTIFPATGYVAMAFEAAGIMAEGRSMRLVQINDLEIDQAIAFLDDVKGIETLFRVYQIRSDGNVTNAAFSCHADIGGTLKTCASGQLVVTWGEMEANLLPSKLPSPSGMSVVDTDEFYASLGKLGYGYTGLFRGITSLKRKLNTSSGFLDNVGSEELLLHPSTMDCGLQCLLAAVGAPGDGELSRLQIPTRIQTTVINPIFCGKNNVLVGDSLEFEAAVTGLSADGASGDVSLFTRDGPGLIQFEGVHVTPLMQPTASDDRPMFSEITWGGLLPNAEPLHGPAPPLQFWAGNMDDPQHMCFAVIQEVLSKLTAEDRQRLEGYRVDVVEWFDHVVEQTRLGENPLCMKEWVDEDPTEALIHLAKTAQPIIVEITDVIRKHFLNFLRGETPMIEVYRQDNLLTRFYDQEQELKYMSLRVGDVAGQLAFRYPRMKILEIGAGTGSATRAVLGRIGQYFHSYTFTDISAGFFEDAEATFTEYADRMVYRVLDIEQDPTGQGFDANSYDLVIAANVLHATKYLEPTMNNVRRLLKPGGHLIALEITNEHILQDALLFSAFEGWWLGKHDNRPWGPKISVPKWEELLRKTGFGGVQSILPAPEKTEYSFWGYSTFVTQAINDRLEQLSEPSASDPATSIISTSDSSEKFGTLMIIGGVTDKTSYLVPALKKLLAPSFERIIHTLTIDSIEYQDASLAAALCLADMDVPTFQDLTDNKISCLKRLLEVGRRLLWVTAGSESENPYLSMSKGFLSCIGYEYEGSIHQYLNIVDPEAVNAQILSTTLMRMLLSDSTNDYSLSTGVGSIELELRLEDNVMKIPRIMNATPLNHRYAAGQRAVYSQADLEKSTVQIRSVQGNLEFFEGPVEGSTETQLDQGQSTIPVHVRYSASLALKVQNGGFLNLVLGTHEVSNVRLIAFSDNNASRVSVPSALCWELTNNIAEDQEAQFLNIMASAVLARNIIQTASTNTSLLVHEANDALRHAIWTQAVAKGVQPYFSTSDTSKKQSNSSTLVFHETSSTRALARILPTGLSVIANFGKAAPNGVMAKIKPLLSPDVTQEDTGTLYRVSPLLSKGFNLDEVTQTFKVSRIVATEVMHSLANNFAAVHGETNVISIDKLSGRDAKTGELEILDWTQARELPVRVSSASSQVKLSASKTYLLVASRTPKVEPQWLDEMSRLGARVRIEPMDVTDRESILSVDRTIRRTLPPIGGVVNGAMVLQDRMFADATLDNILGTYKPKVQGSRLLEDIYGDEDLDFFILFGSATAILGNMGQSSYGAATNFMRSLIRGRRERNLVGSIIHPAEVRGVGYISRMGIELSRLMNKLVGSHIVSEKDLHETFAEAILAGKPASGRNPEVISGFNQHDPEEIPDLIWYSNPETWPLVNYRLQSTTSQSTSTLMPIKQQLESATSLAEAAELVLIALNAKIVQKLHLSEDTHMTPDTRLAELGADSLVAVDLRTWFIRELDVEIPILQIQSGASIGDLANSATSKISDSLIPNVKR